MENTENNQKVNVQNKIVEATSIPKHKTIFAMSQGAADLLAKNGYSENPNDKSHLSFVLQQASGVANKRVPSLAFTENPTPQDTVLGLYKSKRRLIPDEVLKQIRVTDHLVATILRSRGAMMSLFGNLRQNRFDIGLETVIKDDFLKILSPEQYEKVMVRIKKFEQLLLNCGKTEGLESQEYSTFNEFLDVQTRNGLTFGRFATEIIRDRNEDPDEDGNYPFFRFRPVDVATIVRSVRNGDLIGNNVRISAIKALESLTGEKFNIDINALKEDKYAWLQIIDGTVRNAFTHQEMIVFDLFPSTDLEHNGYPVSPLDTIVSSVTTHISIDAYKKLYFQNGRATKGMLVIQSDEVDTQVLNDMRLQFNASINSVSNSFRTPIFGVGTSDKVEWLSMTGEGAKDADFQFMYDQIARNILAAFSISPDEVPGYSHLSRGTNSQTLSESNNEFKLSAARDTGLRPLILKFQIFLNQRLFPMIDPLLSKICEIRLSGIDAQSKEQESTRLQQDMAIHMSFDEVRREVDKEPLGRSLGGEFPFNERYQLILDKYMTVGEIRGSFFGDVSSFIDPLQQYRRDPFSLQWLQLVSQINPAAVKAFFAPKPYAMEFLKMNIRDKLELEGEENV